MTAQVLSRSQGDRIDGVLVADENTVWCRRCRFGNVIPDPVSLVRMPSGKPVEIIPGKLARDAADAHNRDLHRAIVVPDPEPSSWVFDEDGRLIADYSRRELVDA